MSTVPACAIDTFIDAMNGRGDNIGRMAADALVWMGRPAIPRIAKRWLLGNGTQLPYMKDAMSRMPVDLQRELVPSIRRELHSPVASNRQQAAEVLGRLRHTSKEALPLLTEALQDSDADVRAQSAQSIDYLHFHADAAAAVPGLVAMLHHENLPERLWATRALQDIGKPSQDALIPLLQDVSTQTATFAALALASISSATMVAKMPDFEKALLDGSQPARFMSLETMATFGRAAFHAAPLIRAALRDVDPAIRAEAVPAILAVDPDSEESHKALVDAIADPSLQEKIGWELQRHGASSAWAAPLLAKTFLHDSQCFGNPIANDMPRFLPELGVASVEPLVGVLHQGSKCQRVAAAWALGQIKPPTRAASAALLEIVDSPDKELSKQAAESLDKIDPGWFRKHIEPTLAAAAGDEALEIEPASIKNEVVPFLVGELASTKPGRIDAALVDLAYLRTQARMALAVLSALGPPRDLYEKAGIAKAIRLINGDSPYPTGNASDSLVLPMVKLAKPAKPSEYPIVSDIVLHTGSPHGTFRVGEPINLEFDIETSTNKKYIRGSSALRILSATRIDAKGISHPIDVPVTTLYRGGYYESVASAGPSEFDVSHPTQEREDLNYGYILDHPGKYRLVVESVFMVRVRHAAPDSDRSQPKKIDPMVELMREYSKSSQFVRSKSIVVEFELLPRDPEASDRRLWELTADAMRVKSWNDLNSGQDSLAHLLDYRSIPALLHTIEVGGNGTMGAGAVKGLSYLCGKKKLREEILRDIDKNDRPHSEEEARTLAGVLAAAETIPCRPEMSRSDEDYVRWDVSRMRWEDRMMVRLAKH